MKHQRTIRSEFSLSQFSLYTHSLKSSLLKFSHVRAEIVRAWRAMIIAIFYKHLQFHKQNCDNATILQRYSFSNNYHVSFSSDGWSEHLCCGILKNTFDVREIYLRAWVERTKTCEKLYVLRFFRTISTISFLFLSNCEDYFWQEILQDNWQEAVFIVPIKNRSPLGTFPGTFPWKNLFLLKPHLKDLQHYLFLTCN